MSKNTKTVAKRMGVKSVLAYGEDNLAITTFGKGNKADIAVQVSEKGKKLPLPYHTERFTITDLDDDIDLKHGALTSLLDNPAVNTGEDYLGLKETLEKEFFGHSFPGDNIRIQIIHNILDIEKILGLYVNDIIYCINNLQDLNDPEDVLGLSQKGDNCKENLKKMRPYFGFFGDVFHVPPKKQSNNSNSTKNKKTTDLDKTDEHNMNVIRNLSALRHCTAHAKNVSLIFHNSSLLSREFEKGGGHWKTIENNYTKLIERINKDFLDHSKMNLHILFDIYKAKSDQEQNTIANEYYDFSIRKDGKNLGLNMKKLRELMIDKYYREIKDKKHDSYRAKIYTITDYILFHQLNNSEELSQWVAELRATSDEEAKNKIYDNIARLCKGKVHKLLGPFFEKHNGSFPKFSTDDISSSITIKNQLKSQGSILAGGPIPLVQLLTFLCHFMEGKEINELLSAYIHKFENIQSFIDTITELNKTNNTSTDKVVFTKNYDLFNEYDGQMAGFVAALLRILVSIGKMKPDLSEAKRVLFKAAIETLGVNDHHEWISDEWLENNVLVSKEKYKGDELKRKQKEVNPFRNFIANNVIESRRFMYLVRYSKPKAIRALMQNKAIIRYVLTRLPEAQVISYYKSFFKEPSNNTPNEKQYNQLVDILAGLSFESVVNKRSGIIDNSKAKGKAEKNLEIERLKILVGLYLTVAYVAIKNLVKTNARYYIAYTAFERDLELFTKQESKAISKYAISFDTVDKNGNTKQKINKYFSITQYFLDKEDQQDYKQDPNLPFDREACRKHLDSVHRHFTKKWRDIFANQIQEAKIVSKTGYLLTSARNNADHLNVLFKALPEYIAGFRANSQTKEMTSYFELYHYLLQKLMCEDNGLQIPEKYRQFIAEGIPCLDLIKITYIAFGYNLARYKNLTIEALFDKDSTTGKEYTMNRKKGEK